ncbi:RNA polymerase sigma factor [Euzebya tangerina]|uniref:RNA polymerase sigma factor n=1 Tax=Euzebya tangerina TaxID=591198 RepID=UPI0013C3583B|nr:sigma-70 family RNA polymerase sigma factor [Euzebya tangerina]
MSDLNGAHGPDASVTAEAFCRAIRAELVGAMTLFCGDRGVAEELAQEALTRAFERWATLDSPRAWTFATAFNLARSRFRRTRAERRAQARIADLSASPVDPDTSTAIAVRAAVSELPDRQRQVILCRFYGGLSVRETARAMRCAEGTVKSTTSHAIASLRRAGLHIDDTADEEAPTHA